MASVLACTGTHIQDVVGGPHHCLVVLHDYHRVAEVAQVLQRVDEAGIVSGVKAHGGLVADVEDAGEAGADLGG